MVNEFDHDNKLNKYSTIVTVQADQYRPTWIEASVSKDLLEDEIALFQLGYAEEVNFQSLNFLPAKPSSWSKFPTPENPLNKYKFGSVNLFFSADRTVTER